MNNACYMSVLSTTFLAIMKVIIPNEFAIHINSLTSGTIYIQATNTDEGLTIKSNSYFLNLPFLLVIPP